MKWLIINSKDRSNGLKRYEAWQKQVQQECIERLAIHGTIESYPLLSKYAAINGLPDLAEKYIVRYEELKKDKFEQDGR